MKLPLINDHLFLDHSSLEYLQTCPRSAEYHVINGRVSAGSSAALNFGGAIHAALEYRYKHYGSVAGPTAKAEMHAVLTDWFKTNPAPLEDYRCLSLATQVVDGYLAKYASEEWDVATVDGLPAVETPFALPLCRILVRGVWITIMYCGKIDLTVLEGRDYWSLDTKTSKMGGPTVQDEQQMSLQWPGYIWALHQTTGILPYGAIVNFIRVREPNKKGPEDYTPEQLAKKKHKPRRPVEPDDFQRMRFVLQDYHLDEWKEDTIGIIKGFLRDYEDGFFPKKRKWCITKYAKRCPFYEICEMPPHLRQQALQDFTAPDTFSPLNSIKATHANLLTSHQAHQ